MSMVMSRRDALWKVPLVAGAVMNAACGYSLAGRGSFLPDYIRNLGIPLFLNRTPYLTAELMFTEKVRVEFQSRGRYHVQPSEEGADGVVRGEIIGIREGGLNDVKGALHVLGAHQLHRFNKRRRRRKFLGRPCRHHF